MKVIVSKTLEDNYKNFVVKTSLKEVLDLKGVTTVIIHSYKESDFDAGVFITQLKEMGIKTFVYISGNASSTMRLVISGAGGNFYEDEFYFEDEEELMFLLEDIENSGVSEESTDIVSLATPSLNIVTDFIEGYIRGDKLMQTPLYLERVKSAISDLTVLTHQQELQIATMGDTAIEVFEKASKLIINMDNQRKVIEQKLTELEATQQSASTRSPFDSRINYFSPINYMGNKRVCIFKEWSPTRYLTSFVLGYAHHVHYKLNKRVKVIFTAISSYCTSQKYDKLATFINEQSAHMSSLYDAEFIYLSSPKKAYVQDLLNKPVDVVIIVDRLYGRQEIVTGRRKKVDVASSRSDIKRYDLDPSNTIFSVTAQPKQLFCLSTIKGFPIETDSRYATYAQIMNANYEILDEKFMLNV